MYPDISGKNAITKFPKNPRSFANLFSGNGIRFNKYSYYTLIRLQSFKKVDYSKFKPKFLTISKKSYAEEKTNFRYEKFRASS